MTNVPEPESDLEALIASLSPEIRPGSFVFVAAGNAGSDVGPQGELPWLAWVEEPEGPSGVMREEDATELGLPFDAVWAWITLGVASDLSAVGLTAAVSVALADAGLSCNVIAGLRHDHILVPTDHASEALAAIQAIDQTTRST